MVQVVTQEEISAVFTVYEAAVLEITQRKLQNSPGTVYKYLTKVERKLIKFVYMWNLQQPPQIKATRVLLRDSSDLIHKMSHRMALNLKRIRLRKPRELKMSLSRSGIFIISV